MAVFSRIKVWVSGEILTASDLNNEFDNILNNMAPAGIEDASANVSAMQATVDPGGVGTESLATSLLGELQRLRYVIKRIVGAQWYSDPGRTLAAGGLSVQTADIAANAVTTPKIPDGAITPAKLSALNYQKSASCIVFQTTSTSLIDVTNLAVTITTNGRPIMAMLVPDETIPLPPSGSLIFNDGFCYISLYEAGNGKGVHTGNGYAATGGYVWYDTPAAGTYTYRVVASRDSVTGTQISIENVKLLVYEL